MALPSKVTLQASVAGGAPVSGGITASHNQTVALSIQEPAGVVKAKYQIYEYPDGWSVPSGWTEGADGVYYAFTTGGPAPTFTLPVSTSLWGKFFFDVEANDRKRSGKVDQDLYDDRTAISILSPGGLVDVGWREGKQFNAQRSWAGELKKVLRAVASATGAGAAGLTIAGAGLIEAPAGTVNVVAADASISVTADAIAVGVINAPQHGNQTSGTLHAAVSNTAAGFAPVIPGGGGDRALVSNAGGTAATWAKITNAQIDTAAAIAVSKLATGTEGQVLTVVGGVPTWSAAGGGGGGFTDDGAVVRLTTAADNVALGAAAMVGGEKLRVVGATRLEGQVVTTAQFVVDGGVGLEPATTGPVRIPSATFITTRNRNNTGNVKLIGNVDSGGTNVVVVGGDLSIDRPEQVAIDPSVSTTIRVSGTTKATITSSMVAIADALAIGTSPAPSGALRIPKNSSLAANSAAGGVAIALVNHTDFGGLNVVSLGGTGVDTARADITGIRALTNVLISVNSVIRLDVDSTRAQWSIATHEFASTVSSPTIKQANIDGSVHDLTFRAQGRITTNGDGAAIQFQGGKPFGTGLMGAVRGQLNPDDANPQTMFEAAEVAFGQSVLSLVRGANITATHMPTNTGSGVINIAYAQTEPTANPDDSGVIVYALSRAFSEGTVKGLALRGADGDATLTAANGNPGRNLYLLGGDSTDADGDGGDVEIWAGEGGATSGVAGDLVLGTQGGGGGAGAVLVRITSGQTMAEFNSTGFAFNGQTPIARPSYTTSNVATNRVIDASTISAADLADVVGTMIEDLITYGIYQ